MPDLIDGDSMNGLFDVFLYEGCTLLPNLVEFSELVPPVTDSAWLARLTTDRPGYLGVSLARDTALALLKVLAEPENGANGMLVPTRYRDTEARISPDEAYSIARAEMPRNADDALEETLQRTRFMENQLWYTFSFKTVKSMKEDRVPGALFIYVDKIDGHIWSDDEQERLFVRR